VKELVEHLVRRLVDYPEEVSVTEIRRGDDTVTYEIRVADTDFGKIVGKGGSIANAVRTLVRAAAATKGVRAFVDII
jgi:predicted RNA-binding protein YlqC (UPF0109 family)